MSDVEYGRYEFDPDYQPKAPLCMRCGREASNENPVRVSLRPTQHPYGKWNTRKVDAICADCIWRLKLQIVV